MTAGEFRDEVLALAKGLLAQGIRFGDRVAIMSRTRYEWTLFDFALWTIGAQVVPVYSTSSAEQCFWMLYDAECTAAIVEHEDHAMTIATVIDRLPGCGSCGSWTRAACRSCTTPAPPSRTTWCTGTGKRLPPTRPRRSSTPRARPAGPRAVSSRTATSCSRRTRSSNAGSRCSTRRRATRPRPCCFCRSRTSSGGWCRSPRSAARSVSATSPSCTRPPCSPTWPLSDLRSSWPCRTSSRRCSTRRAARRSGKARRDRSRRPSTWP